MPARQIANQLICLLVPIVACGCQTLSRDRPIGVEVVDAETKKPVPGAQVKITYPMSQTGVSLQQSTIPAGGDGIAHLKVASTSDYGIILEAFAEGYLRDDLNVSSASVQRIAPAGIFENPDHRAANYRLELYSVPDFSIELIVPLGYHGVVRAKTKFEKDVSFPARQRLFQFEVAKSGTVELAGPAILRQILPVDYIASFTDGNPLSKTPDDLTVGIKYWKMDGAEQLFVVGTKIEIDGYVRSSSSPSIDSSTRSSGGRGNGSGGGGRRRGGGGGAGSGGSGGGSPSDGTAQPPW
jgi:uncharacterized membrane protein YgcG